MKTVNLGLSLELQLIVNVSIDSEQLIYPLESVKKTLKNKSLGVGG